MIGGEVAGNKTKNLHLSVYHELNGIFIIRKNSLNPELSEQSLWTVSFRDSFYE